MSVFSFLSPFVSVANFIFNRIHQKKLYEAQLDSEKSTALIAELASSQAKTIEMHALSYRAEVMPYLIINKDIKVRLERGTVLFEVSFINRGKGLAVDLQGKYLDNLSGVQLCPMYESAVAVYGCACPFDYQKSIVASEETCVFEMYQSLRYDGIEVSQDKVTISVRYKDLLQNQYEQSFTFLFSGLSKHERFEVHRVSSGIPILVTQAKTA